jgi:hypothetical protein
MNDTIRNWLPMTKRNHVALGFAFAALAIFVTWNLFPYYHVSEKSYANSYMDSPIYERDGFIFIKIWPGIVHPDNYLYVIKSPSIRGFFGIAACVSLLLNAFVVMTLVPFWKVIHASKYLTIPLGVFNILGGSVVFRFLYEDFLKYRSPNAPYEIATHTMIALSMWALAAALFIFKNELELRHEQEVEKTMGEE